MHLILCVIILSVLCFAKLCHACKCDHLMLSIGKGETKIGLKLQGYELIGHLIQNRGVLNVDL